MTRVDEFEAKKNEAEKHLEDGRSKLEESPRWCAMARKEKLKQDVGG